MGIADQQLAQYERDGFLVLEDFVDEESCDRLRYRAEEVKEETENAQRLPE